MAHNGELDRGKCRYSFFIRRMCRPCIGQFIHMVKLGCGQRHSRPVLDDHSLRVLLGNRSATYRVLILVMEPEGPGV